MAKKLNLIYFAFASLMMPVLAFAGNHSQVTAALKEINSCNRIAVPVALNIKQKSDFVRRMVDFLSRRVIGQDLAIETIANAIEMALANLHDPEKPLGKILLLGPTGVGKTEIVKALVQFLGGDIKENLIRVPGGELQEAHHISRLNGAAAGLVGHDVPPFFDPKNLEKSKIEITLPNGTKRWINIVLLDEIEKAHDAIFKILLEALDEGRMTMAATNEAISFKDTLFISTSNLGVSSIEALIKSKEKQLKDSSHEFLSPQEADLTGRLDLQLGAKMDESYDQAVSGRFSPEFRNRFDAIVRLRHLTTDHFLQIANKMMADFQRRIFAQSSVKVAVLLSEEAQNVGIARGTNFMDGARALERFLKGMAMGPVSRLVTGPDLHDGDVILIEPLKNRTGNGVEFEWTKVAQGLTRPEMLSLVDRAYPGYDLLHAPFEVKEKPIRPTQASAASKSINPDILNELKNSQSLLLSLYTEISHQPIKTAIRVDANSSATEPLTLKYLKIRGGYLEIWNRVGGRFEIKQKDVLPANLDKLQGFDIKDIPEWTEEQLKDFVSERKKSS